MALSHLQPIIASIILLFTASVSASAVIKPRDLPETPFIRTLYQYPLGTWIENIAVRPSGELLLTILNVPHLDHLDPFTANSTPTTVYDFAGLPNATSVFGIAEVDDDAFAVAVGNFSFATGPAAGSWGIWGVNFKNGSIQVDVNKIAGIPEATYLNGLCNLPSSAKTWDILVGDIRRGVVIHVQTRTGDHEVAVNNSLTAAVTYPAFGTAGVNGIHVKDNELYFVNTGEAIFAKVPIDATTGAAAGEASVIAHVLNSTLQFDDFAIQGEDAYLVTGSGNSIEKIGLDGTPKGRIIAGQLNSTQFAEPTACAFGRTDADKHVLYVVTAGGLAAPVDGDITVGGQVLALDTRMWDDLCS